MKYSNIDLGENVQIDPSSTINNCLIEDNVKIAKRCSVYGGEDNQLQIGKDTYVGPNTILNGFAAKLIIGEKVSIAQNVNIMCDSGPNNEVMQRVFSTQKGDVTIGDLCWIGASVIIMPGVSLGRACVVGANSYVNKSFEDYCIVGGSPAKLIRKLTDEEICEINR